MPRELEKFVFYFVFTVMFSMIGSASAQNLFTGFVPSAVVLDGKSYGGSGAYASGVATSSGSNFTGVSNTLNMNGWHLFSYTISGNSLAPSDDPRQSISKIGINGGRSPAGAPSGLGQFSVPIIAHGLNQIAIHFLGADGGNFSISNIYLQSLSAQVVSPFSANTQQSLVNTSQVLQSAYTLQNSVLANSFSYDCSLFDKNNICISAGGRNTAVAAANGLNNTSGLLIGAYRVLPSIRIGAYIDQNFSVNNAGSTVSLGNNAPLIGLFGAWNERHDGTGSELKASVAYGQKNTTITRQVVGISEAGAGSSQLNSQGFQVLGRYGYALMENIIFSPYVGIRYTQNNMGGYTESASSASIAPLTYGALNTNATTALVGLGTSYRGIPKANFFASAGVESDTNTSNGSYSATGVYGLTPINFNPNPVKTRPTVTLGATYDVEKNQRIGITGIYRQEPFQAISTTSVMATYTVGL